MSIKLNSRVIDFITLLLEFYNIVNKYFLLINGLLLYVYYMKITVLIGIFRNF